MSKKKTKIIFAGTNDFSFQHLESLFFSNYIISAIITKKKIKKYDPIKKFALINNIIILEPENLKTKKFYNQIKKINAKILIVCSYGMLIPKKIIQLFKKNAINIHASLLPRWRGAAPVQWAIISGDVNTGISIIQMNTEIDAGKILYSKSCSILMSDTTETIYEKIKPISIKAMHHILTSITRKKKIKKHKQDIQKITYAPKIQKKDARISWDKTAKYNERLIRALTPHPYCYFILNNTLIKIIRASVLLMNDHQKKYKIGEIVCANKLGIQIYTKKNLLNIEKVQVAGSIPMHVSQLLNSKKHWFSPGIILL